MKHLAFYGLIFLIACSNNNASEEKQLADNSSTETKSVAASAGDDIVGEWEMVGFIGDTNDNLQIDEDERKNLKTPSFKDYMKLNRDGSGLFTVAKLEGRYEIKQNESNGRKDMTWFDKTSSPHRMGSIMKVTKEELHIKEPGGDGLFLWKRL